MRILSEDQLLYIQKLNSNDLLDIISIYNEVNSVLIELIIK